MRSRDPLVQLLRKISNQLDGYKRYEPPEPEEREQAGRWLTVWGATEYAASRAVREANLEAKREDIPFVEALHKVSNRASRGLKPGWERFQGDWTKR